MYVKRKYGFWMTFYWSSKPFIIGTIYSGIIFILSWYLDVSLAVPWQPMSIMGIAVAFYLGFKNNSSYDRTWEARKIWGSIVNDSRSISAVFVAVIQGENATALKKEFVYRHIAWMTALRYQLRQSREWEHNPEKLYFKAEEITEDYKSKMASELQEFLSPSELEAVMKKSNVATQLLANQSAGIQDLNNSNYINDFQRVELSELITALYADQGKAERIKNFPFPRQYASTSVWLSLVFAALLPFGILDIFEEDISWVYWLTPFFSGLIIWIYFLMEKIGDYSENPFEGSYNDVPITSISRGIEIDLKEMIDDDNIPPAIKASNGILL